MTSRRVTILPTGPPSSTAPPLDHGPQSSARSFMRRQMTQNACIGCRKKRTKCDGKSPCSRCVSRGEQCVFKAKASISKQHLRDEVETLKQERLNNRAVLNALLLDQHEAIVQRLRAGEPVGSIAQSLAGQDTRDSGDDQDDNEEEEEDDDEEAERQEAGDSKEGILPDKSTASLPVPSRSADGTSASDSKFDADCFNPTISSADGNISVPEWLASARSPAAGSPPFPTRPDTARRRHSFGANDPSIRPPALGNGTWTKVTANRTLLGHLLGLFFSWEFPPFTMVSQDLFLRDYRSGGRRFCSPALVNAVASVATRYLEPTQTTSPGDAYLLGEQFFAEAKGLLVLEAQIPNLPSIQALALLAVREMSCGRELEAQELCLQALRLLGALDFEDLEGHGNGKRRAHLTVRCITYTGVLSLTRAIRLITDQLSPASNHQYSKVPLVSTLIGHDGDFLAAQLQQRMNALRSRLDSQAEPEPADVLSGFIFNQTEYVYSFLSRIGEPGGEKALDQLPGVYQRCLESYETITNFLKRQGDSSPCTLFVHIYFHFCLLALFRPFIHYGVEVAGASPRTVCAEAVQAILDVTQSYASLFTLRRTPCFIPYFVFAAGLTRIVLEGGSTSNSTPSASPSVADTDTSSPYRRAAVDDNGDTSMTGTDDGQTPFSPTSTERTNSVSTSVSANTRQTSITSMGKAPEEDRGMTQAVQQLQEMSVGHPAAAQAGWVLRDLNPNRKE